MGSDRRCQCFRMDFILIVLLRQSTRTNGMASLHLKSLAYVDSKTRLIHQTVHRNGPAGVLPRTPLACPSGAL
jgi:hypothetical protein